MTNNISRTDKNIYFLAYTALGCAWDYYWSHEMAHAIDKEIFLNGEQRGITNNEDYTDGFLTQGFGGWTYVMNLTFDWDLSKDVSSSRMVAVAPVSIAEVPFCPSNHACDATAFCSSLSSLRNACNAA